MMSFNSISLQSGERIKQPKYIKKGNIWYVEEKGKLYELITDIISVKFKAGIRTEEIDKFIDSLKLKIKNINRLGIYDLEFVKDREIFKVIHEVKQSELVEFAEVNSIGKYIIDKSLPTEMIIKEKRFIRKNNKWHLKSNERLYEVITNSLSCKFKKETTLEQQKEFFDTHQLKVIRKNRLGIYDVEILSQKTAIEVFADLQDESWLEFVEINTLGHYEME